MSSLSQYVSLLLRNHEEPGWKKQIPAPPRQIRVKPVLHPYLDINDRSPLDQVRFWRRVYENGFFNPHHRITERDVVICENHLPAITRTFPHRALPPSLQQIQRVQRRLQGKETPAQPPSHIIDRAKEVEEDKQPRDGIKDKSVSFYDEQDEDVHTTNVARKSPTISEKSIVESFSESSTPSPTKMYRPSSTIRATSAPASTQMMMPSPELPIASASPTSRYTTITHTSQTTSSSSAQSQGTSNTLPSLTVTSDHSGCTDTGSSSYSVDSYPDNTAHPRAKRLLRRPIEASRVLSQGTSRASSPLGMWRSHSFTTVCVDDPLDENGFYRRNYPLLMQQVPRRPGSLDASQGNTPVDDIWRPLPTPNISLAFLGQDVKWKKSVKSVNIWDAFDFP